MDYEELEQKYSTFYSMYLNETDLKIKVYLEKIIKHLVNQMLDTWKEDLL